MLMNELSLIELEKGYIQLVKIDEGILLMGGNSIDCKRI